MNRLYVAGAALLIIIILSITSCNLYKGKVSADLKNGITQGALTEAVAESKEALKVDVQTQAKKAVALDSVRPAIAIAREKYVRKENPVGVPVDPWISVFNDAVRASNGAIESSGNMSGAM